MRPADDSEIGKAGSARGHDAAAEILSRQPIKSTRCHSFMLVRHGRRFRKNSPDDDKA
jgi:hypothetical protein